ncbi:MAG: hypothetical protein M1269_01345 [Chloroflexi bacterium]|nr:hypothetical protein [Chloroflexota bacterium]
MSIIELMIVIVIIGTLFNVALPAYQRYLTQTKVQNAAVQMARDIEWARNLSLKYEDNAYIALEDASNSESNHFLKIYMATAVPLPTGSGGSTITNYGTRDNPLLLRDFEKSGFGDVVLNFAGGYNSFAIGAGGMVYSGSPATNILQNMTIQASLREFVYSFNLTPSGQILFNKAEGL